MPQFKTGTSYHHRTSEKKIRSFLNSSLGASSCFAEPMESAPVKTKQMTALVKPFVRVELHSSSSQAVRLTGRRFQDEAALP